jgi:4-aminobutyrate aminotransferase
MFATEHFDIVPEIIAVAKSLGGGLPIGATVFKSNLDFGVKGAHSNTYGGNLVCCAAALAAIETIEREKLVVKSARNGRYLQRILYELKDKYDIIGDVRGLGLMQATEIIQPGTKKPFEKLRDTILKNAYENGLLLLPCGDSTIRYIPPLTVSKNEIEEAIQILESAIKKSV